MRATPNTPRDPAEREPPTMALTVGIMLAQGSAIVLLLIALAGVVMALS